MTNSTKYQIVSALMPTVSLFASGSYIQTFLSESEISLSAISTFTSALSLVQIIVMIINIFAVDRIKNVLRFQKVLMIGCFIGCAALVPACLAHEINGKLFGYIVAVCLVVNAVMGLYNVLSFKMAYHVVNMDEYSAITNNISIVSGILAIIIGMIISQLAYVTDFSNIMIGGFVICMLFCLLSAFFTASMKPNTGYREEKNKGRFSFTLLKKREFTYFYIPNLIRGLSMSAVNVMPLIFVKSISSNSAAISMLVNIMSISTIAGCILYRLIVKKVKTVTVYFVSSVAIFLFMPALLLGYSIAVFYVFYFFLGLFYNINAVAAAVYPAEYVEYDHIGTYTSVRLIILTIGQAAGAYIIGIVINSIPSLAILLVCAILQLASGIAFWKYKKQPAPDTEQA